METVPGVGVANDLDLRGRGGRRGTEGLDFIDRDALIEISEQSDHGAGSHGATSTSAGSRSGPG